MVKHEGPSVEGSTLWALLSFWGAPVSVPAGLHPGLFDPVPISKSSMPSSKLLLGVPLGNHVSPSPAGSLIGFACRV